MLTPIEKLDVVLKWLVEHSKRFWTTEDIIEQADYGHLLAEIDMQLLHVILEWLVKDRNASIDETERTYRYTLGESETKKVWLYKITYDSIIFCKRGGYEKWKEIQKKKRIAHQQRRELINKQIQSTIASNEAVKELQNGTYVYFGQHLQLP